MSNPAPERITEVQALTGNGKEPSALVPLPVSASPLDLPAEVFRAGLDRRKENRAALMEWIRSALVEGVDYGRIHVVGKDRCKAGRQCTNPAHFSKPSLFKPGAEKICGMLGVTVHFPTLHDYEMAALNGVQLLHVILRCELNDASDRVIAHGVGARSLKQDYGDINKALKMAAKSAHIDATLRMAGLSEVFTQDMEDMNHGEDVAAQTEGARGNPLGSEPGVTREEAPRKISESEKRGLEARIGELKLDRERVKDWIKRAWNIEHFADLTTPQLQRLEHKLAVWVAQPAVAAS